MWRQAAKFLRTEARPQKQTSEPERPSRRKFSDSLTFPRRAGTRAAWGLVFRWEGTFPRWAGTKGLGGWFSRPSRMPLLDKMTGYTI